MPVHELWLVSLVRGVGSIKLMPVWPLSVSTSNSPVVNDWSFLKIGRLSSTYAQYCTRYIVASFRAALSPSPAKVQINYNSTWENSLQHFKCKAASWSFLLYLKFCLCWLFVNQGKRVENRITTRRCLFRCKDVILHLGIKIDLSFSN